MHPPSLALIQDTQRLLELAVTQLPVQPVAATAAGGAEGRVPGHTQSQHLDVAAIACRQGTSRLMLQSLRVPGETDEVQPRPANIQVAASMYVHPTQS
jgi:hypothetical protein